MEYYFFIGIKGAGMSALAQILFDTGSIVTGCDIPEYVFTEKSLMERGMKYFTFDETLAFESKEKLLENGFQNTDAQPILIIGNAFSDEHPVVQHLKGFGFSFVRYHVFLTHLIKNHTSVAISGTHGKTTTTGLFSHSLSKLLPCHTLIGDGTGRGMKNASHFLFEACEYRNHFHSYFPDYAVVTNIELDHPDFFKTEEDVISSFLIFASQVKKNVIACGDDLTIRSIARYPKWITYGLKAENDIQAVNIRSTYEGTTFDVVLNRDDLFYNGKKFQNVFVPLHGNHIVQNTLSVIAFALLEQFDSDMFSLFLKEFSSFEGVKRRFQLEQVKDVMLINDYAHHPTEINATISATRGKFPKHEVVAIFQPHTYSRTSMFLKEFAMSLSKADSVYLCDIFGSARESEGNITIDDLLNQIPNGKRLIEEDVDILLSHQNAVFVFMGAGDIEKYMNRFKNVLEFSLKGV